MHLTVAGVVTSVETDVKNEKKVTNVMLAQGKKMQVAVRFEGHEFAEVIDLYQPLTVTGDLMMWSTRNGADSLVMAKTIV